MQGLEVSGAVRPIYGSLGVTRLNGVNSTDCVFRFHFVIPDPPSSEPEKGRRAKQRSHCAPLDAPLNTCCDS